jgi:copper chaperone CopZ
VQVALDSGLVTVQAAGAIDLTAVSAAVEEAGYEVTAS